MSLIAHVLGLDNPSGAWYLFWSGFAGDIPELAIIGLVWRRLNCHEHKCWRIGLHHRGHEIVCRKHSSIIL